MFACLLLGCNAAAAFAQKPMSPLVDAPAAFKNAPQARPGKTAGAPVPASAAAGAWWHVFHDATLDALEQRASGANQDLRQAVLRIEEARQQTRNATASYFPTVEANLSAERVRINGTSTTDPTKIPMTTKPTAKPNAVAG